MTKQQKAEKILQLLEQEYPEIEPFLNHSCAHELLFATILSARSTDANINALTPALFARYPKVEDYAVADMDELRMLVKSSGFYNNKAKSIQGSAQKIVQDFDSEVPDNMQDLITLPGVARKTANVVLGQWFIKNEGLAVDTHVIRLSNWFGLSDHSDPVKIERDLMELFPQNKWSDVSLRVILLGRNVLTARNPQHEGTIWEEYVQI